MLVKWKEYLINCCFNAWARLSHNYLLFSFYRNSLNLSFSMCMRGKLYICRFGFDISRIRVAKYELEEDENQIV